MTIQGQGACLRVLRGGHVYAPDDLGERDILIAAGKILAVGKNLQITASDLVETVDMSGRLVFPGFIDSHAHIVGGGGKGGPQTRDRDLPLANITRAGVTTIIGLIGFDCVTRSVVDIVSKARALTVEGITAYALTGGYAVPPPTLLGSVSHDLVFIDVIVGVGEIAISDHRSSQPTDSEIAKIAAEAHVGGMVGNKSGTLVFHIGDGSRYLQQIVTLLETTEIPADGVVVTHVNRSSKLLEQAIDFARRFGNVDVTSGVAPARGFPRAIKPSEAVKTLLDAEVPIDRITMSSDANGSESTTNEDGEVIKRISLQTTSLYDEFRDLIRCEQVPIDQAVRIVTENPATIYRLHRKGGIAPGKDADLTITDPELRLLDVYARGRLLVKDGEPIVHGAFE